MNLKRDKGSHKDYAYWLSTEIDDYVCKADYDDPLEKYDAILSEANQTQDEETNPNPIYVVSKKKKPLRVVKTVKNAFAFLPYMTKLSPQALHNLASFLHVKDLVGLTMTCKQLYTALNEENVWKTVCRRDFDTTIIDDERLLLVESPKLLYRYQVYRNKAGPGILHHTGLFWKDGTLRASILAQHIVDFVAPKHLAIKESMHILKLRNYSKIGNVLKLSWLRDKNEVWLWFSGQALANPSAQDKTNQKKERLDAHVLRIYRGLDDEVIQNTFFLEDRYVVIEVVTYLNESDDEEEEALLEKKNDKIIQKSASTFIIYDLENELKWLVTEEEYDVPLRYSFENGIFEDLSEEEEQEEEEVEDEEEKSLENNHEERKLDTKSEQITEGNRSNLKVKLLNAQDAIFYQTNTNCPLIKIVNLKTRNEASSAKIELNSPIEDLIFLKNPSLAERTSFYIIDQTQNVYQFTWTNNSLTLVNKIILPNEEVVEEEDPRKAREKIGYPDMCHYSQGSYNKPGKDGKNVAVEYLIIKKGSTLHFIGLETLEVHDYKPKIAFENWTTYEDKLLFASGSQVSIYKFSFHDFDVKEIGTAKSDFYIGLGFISQAILVNSCYTVQIVCYNNPQKGGDIFEVSIESTQHLLSAAQVKSCYRNEEYNITGILSSSRKKVLPFLAENQFEIRFEDRELFLKSPYHTVLFELENYWKAKHIVSSSKWEVGYGLINFNEMKDREIIEEGKKNQEKKVKLVTQFQKIPVNKNAEGKKEKSNNKWSGKGQKGNKEENQEKQIIRHKGQKYRKNVQQNQRSEKHG